MTDNELLTNLVSSDLTKNAVGGMTTVTYKGNRQGFGDVYEVPGNCLSVTMSELLTAAVTAKVSLLFA